MNKEDWTEKIDNLLLFWHWNKLPILFSLSIAVAGFIWFKSQYPNLTLESIRSTIETTLQVTGAILGLLLVGVPILWDQASKAEERLFNLRTKYLQILSGNLKVRQLNNLHLEKIRKDFLAKMRSRKLPRNPFPYEHEEYKNNRDLFLSLSKLTNVVAQFLGIEDANEIQNDLEKSRYTRDEIESALYIEWYALRSRVTDFFETLFSIFTPANLTLYEIRGGGDLAEEIWENSIDDGSEESLERVNHFRKHIGPFFYLIFIVLLIGIFLGIGILSISSHPLVKELFILEITLTVSGLVLTFWYIWSFICSYTLV